MFVIPSKIFFGISSFGDYLNINLKGLQRSKLYNISLILNINLWSHRLLLPAATHMNFYKSASIFFENVK